MRCLFVLAFIVGAASAVSISASARASASSSYNLGPGSTTFTGIPGTTSASASASASATFNGQQQQTYSTPTTASSSASASVNYQNTLQPTQNVDASQVQSWQRVSAADLCNLPEGYVVRKVTRGGPCTYLQPRAPCRQLVTRFQPCAPPCQVYRPCVRIPTQTKVKSSASASASAKSSFTFQRPEITVLDDCVPDVTPTVITPEITITGSSSSSATTTVNGEIVDHQEETKTIDPATYSDGQEINLSSSATATANAEV